MTRFIPLILTGSLLLAGCSGQSVSTAPVSQPHPADVEMQALNDILQRE
ncbi:hypothetical protein [Effusibacillus lacus]|nr:hypothetical protein [Effusibacillus lacus]TCS74163.1 hypothetical protein EDD64_11517 [Effusibacillus lacus]